jgi:DNA-binding NtrC family response regulator
MPRILVVGPPEPDNLPALAAPAVQPGGHVLAARTAAEAARLAADARPDVILLAVPPGRRDALRNLRRPDPRVPVVAVEDTPHDAAAFESLPRPVRAERLRLALAAAVAASRFARTPVTLDPDAADPGDGEAVVGRCPALRELRADVDRVAPQDAAVLITGEPGTGKSLLARALVQRSHRADRPFLACAGLSESQAESELFGHEPGAFPGADRRRFGRLEQCDGGTLLLDEVGELPAGSQAKLLGLLRDGRFERAGGPTVAVDVRLIVTTRHDLKALAAAGRFLPELAARLGAVTLALPPLRERGDDVDLLVTYFVGQLSRGRGQADVEPVVRQRLRAHDWPGNVKELRAVVAAAVGRASGSVVRVADLPAELAGPWAVASSLGLEAFVRGRLAEGTHDLWAEVARRVDEVLLPLVMEHTGGNQMRAAQLLGVARQTLRTRLRELGLANGRGHASDEGG